MQFLKIICRTGLVQNFHDISHCFEAFCEKKASRGAGSLYDDTVDIFSATLHDLVTQHFLQRMLCRTFFDCQKKILVRTAGKRYEVRPYFTFTVGSFYISMLSQVIPVDRLQRTGIQHPVLERCLLLVLMSKCNIIKSTVCQFTEIHRDMLSISTMRHQNVKSSFIGFLPAIIKCFVNLLMFVTQTIYIDVFLRNLNTGMALSVKK